MTGYNPYWEDSSKTKPIIGSSTGRLQKRTHRMTKYDECEDEIEVKPPEDYASDIIELEIKVEEPDVPLEVVQELLNLYSRAIDYYVKIGSEKYKYYKKKIASLMIQPQVIECMEVSYNKKRFEKKAQDVSCSDLERRDMESLMKPNYKKVDLMKKRQNFEVARDLGNIDKFDKMKELVRTHEMHSNKNHMMIQSNIIDQLESLKTKLKIRKLNTNKSNNESTISGFSTYRGHVNSGVAEDSVRTESQERKSGKGQFEEEPVLVFKGGLKRCGSHKIYPVSLKEAPQSSKTNK